jgi:S-adenosylmethionine:tRNA ribosyltransferase-isomerase
MHPKNLSISQFDYCLPDERIAKYPLEERDSSKLLIYKNGKIQEDAFSKLSAYIPSASLMIFNNTKVVQARIFFKKHSGTTIEIFCLGPDEIYKDITEGMLQVSRVKWECLIGNAKKWKDELLIKTFNFRNKQVQLTAKQIAKKGDAYLIEFNWNDDRMSFAEVLHGVGVMPLPPYLNREAGEEDTIRYQTVYAEQNGSVAAPTAGLHFTKELFLKLKGKKIDQDFVTLHVGAGTFKPVKAATLEYHEMHAEYFEIRKEQIENILKNLDNTIIAVGTTTLRALESLYWMGLKLTRQSKSASLHAPGIEEMDVKQWDPYELQDEISVDEALHALLLWMQQNNLESLLAKTQILIAPSYKLKIADALITNFHQPKSTLLLLIAALIGDNWKRVYDYGLQNNFRFLSYGDSCLLFPER